MKKYLLYTIVVLGIGSMLTTSCLEENLGVGNIKQEMQGGEGWNKIKPLKFITLLICLMQSWELFRGLLIISMVWVTLVL